MKIVIKIHLKEEEDTKEKFVDKLTKRIKAYLDNQSD